jgi:hypothetical protein
MATDLTAQSAELIVDLTGLPEQTVRTVLRLVNAARETQMTPAPRSSSRDDLQQWSAEWRAWTSRHPKRDLTLDDDRDAIYAGCGE